MMGKKILIDKKDYLEFGTLLLTFSKNLKFSVRCLEKIHSNVLTKTAIETDSIYLTKRDQQNINIINLNTKHVLQDFLENEKTRVPIGRHLNYLNSNLVNSVLNN